MLYSRWRDVFKSRLRALIENHEDLSISEVGRRLGHKTGTNVSVMISKSKSGRDDLRLSTFLRLCSVLVEAYVGRKSEREIVLFLLGFNTADTSSEQGDSFEYPLSRAGEDEKCPIGIHAE